MKLSILAVRLRSMGKKTTILATACIIMVVVVFFQLIVFKTPALQPKDYSTAYYNEFDKTPTTSYNYSFSPPVSMYQALLIALQSGGWTASSLTNMTIHVELDYCAFGVNCSLFEQIYPVTSPPANWFPQQVNNAKLPNGVDGSYNVTYRYVWTIIVEYSTPTFSIPPAGYYYVDAATAELVPSPQAFF
jgi:hypothetical protein